MPAGWGVLNRSGSQFSEKERETGSGCVWKKKEQVNGTATRLLVDRASMC